MMEYRIVSLIRGHTDAVTTLSLNPRLLASAGEDGRMFIWSPSESCVPIQNFPSVSVCTHLKFHPGNHNILYSAHGRYIKTWDIRNCQTWTDEWLVNEEEVNCIDVLPDESRLAAADDSGAVQIIDIDTGRLVRTLKKHDNICSVAKFRPRRPWQVISGGLDCRLVLSDWKGSGLAVAIFELNEIVGGPFDGDTLPQQDEHVTGSSGSETSTSEFADPDYDFEPGYEGARQYGDLPTNTATNETERPNLLNNIFSHTPTPSPYVTRQPMESATTSTQSTTLSSSDTPGQSGFRLNPPMVHSVACSATGDYIAAGLESTTIEMFTGEGKRLSRLQSLYGHERGVSALHFILDSYLISGGNDCQLFVWTMKPNMVGSSVFHGEKICAIEGRNLERTIIADCSPTIQVLDLSVT